MYCGCHNRDYRGYPAHSPFQSPSPTTLTVPVSLMEAATADVAGGKGPFEYQWSGGAADGEAVTGLTAGDIYVTVTDAVGTQATGHLVMEEPAPLQAQAIGLAPASTGMSNGRGKMEVTGGTGPYTYDWEVGSGDGEITDLAPGIHVITVTDVNGCTATASLEVTEDILPLTVALIETSELNCTGDTDGKIGIEIGGGKAPFEYAWSTGQSGGEVLENVGSGSYSITVTDVTGTTAVTTIEVVDPPQLSLEVVSMTPATADQSDGQVIVEASGGDGTYSYAWDGGLTNVNRSSLAAGKYPVTVTDGKGCTTVIEAEITENILPMSVSLREMGEIKCTGDETASVSVTVLGGKGPFNYNWNEASMNVEDLEGLQTGISVSGVGAGSYALTVTDATGLSATGNIVINEPSALQTQMNVESPASTDNTDGRATVVTSGGTEPYSFEWDNGETAETAVALGPGERSVIVTDGNGCTSSASSEISENIIALGVNISANKEQISCNGDSDIELSVDVTGGKGPFTFVWNDGIESESVNQARSGLGAGDYAITVTDALGTTAASSISIQQPDALTAEAFVLAAATTDQSDGKAEINITGGTAPFTYAWDNGETEATATTLAPGDRSVTVTDANGCSSVAVIAISEDILELGVRVEATSEIACAGSTTGAVSAIVSGGKQPYSIAWSDGASAAELSGLSAGTYAVTVSDAVGQTATASYAFTEPDALSIEVKDIRPATAENKSDGKASVEASGGAGNYTFAWDSGAKMHTATELGIGNHSVTVTDGNGCTASANFEVAKKILPLLTAEALQSGKGVRMEKLQFEADSSNINNESKPALNELYQFLYDNPSIVVEIGGHTNGLPEHDYCDSLSRLRAKAVAEYIVQQGIDGKRVYYKGYGKRKPIATNQTSEGRRRNQRVEVRMLEMASRLPGPTIPCWHHPRLNGHSRFTHQV